MKNIRLDDKEISHLLHFMFDVDDYALTNEENLIHDIIIYKLREALVGND